MPSSTPNRRSPAKRRAFATAASVGCHVLIALAVVATRPPVPPSVQAPTMTAQMVTLIDLTPPPPAPTLDLRPEQPAPSAPKAAEVVREPVHPTPLHVKPRASTAPSPIEASAPAAAQVASDGWGAMVGDGEGAGGDGSGAGHGGACDMAGRLEKALERDPLATSAVADVQRASGRTGTITIWNGDWIQAPNQDGKGLTAVRQAVEWAIAFAPAACKSETVRGPVLLSLHGGARATRIALGYGQWRWSDLLNLGPTRTP